jgi:hypothetical protein
MIRTMKDTLPNLLARISIGAIALVAAVMNAPATALGQSVEMTEQQMDMWIYNGNSAGLNSDEVIRLAIETVDAACHLTPAQQEKLRLAAQGDFARFNERADDLRAQYLGKSIDQNDLGNVVNKFQPLAQTYRSGLLGYSSLFAKVLRHTLTPEQLKEYEDTEQERMQQRHAAAVRLYVALLGRACALTDDQRSQLVDLLLKETHAPKRPSEYDYYVVLAQAANVPNEKYTAILDTAQMDVVKNSLNRGRGLAAFLKQQDILP